MSGVAPGGKNLGYIDPKEAKLRCVHECVFVPPQVSQDDADKDIESLDKRISDAKAAVSKFAKSKHGVPIHHDEACYLFVLTRSNVRGPNVWALV